MGIPNLACIGWGAMILSSQDGSKCCMVHGMLGLRAESIPTSRVRSSRGPLGPLPVQCETAVGSAEPAARPDPRIQIESQPQTEQRPVGEAPAEVAADLVVVPALRALEGRHLAVS